MYLTQKYFLKIILIYISILIIPISLLSLITYYVFKNIYINHLWIFLAIPLYIFAAYMISIRKFHKRYIISKTDLSDSYVKLLIQNIPYFKLLNKNDQKIFSKEVEIFISEKEILGIETTISDLDRVMVASSAIIPIFKFPQFEYDNVTTIILYPERFNTNFDTDGADRSIMGLVGIGDVVAFSKRDLHNGFKNYRDRSNVGFHEFIHKIDDKDGIIDGIPLVLLDRKLVGKWEAVVSSEMELIRKGESDFNSYGLKNKAEFFAVASEYYFEAPEKMEINHPALYELFFNIFKQDLITMYKNLTLNLLKLSSKKIPRNSLCPCGSGKKYKHCCYMKL